MLLFIQLEGGLLPQLAFWGRPVRGYESSQSRELLRNLSP